MGRITFALLLAGAPVGAQTPAPPVAQATPAPAKRSYTPADFARFAPRTGFDMLEQVPGFTIRGASDERGLGQATENVLINGQRIADKSGGAIDALTKVPAAQVERIDIVDAASLGLAGLTGEVANVIVRASTHPQGQFAWEPGWRAHYTSPQLLGGSASLTGRHGPVDYTLSLADDAGRGGFGGPVILSDATGAVTERRVERFHGEFLQPNLKTRFGLDGPGSATAQLSLAVAPHFEDSSDRERRLPIGADPRTRETRGRTRGGIYDFNATIDVPLDPGRLKLIGLRHYEYLPTSTTQVTTFDSGAPAVGVRVARDIRASETIERAEFGWTGGRNAWQLTAEHAVNTLDQEGTLSSLTTIGVFAPVPFPDGTGHVKEVRFEGTGTLSRTLTRRLDLQVVIGAEQSSLARLDGDVPARHFVRPKGSASLAWRPAIGWDASLKLARTVGQIDFGDFLARPNLQQDRQNAGNPDLVPPQSWDVEAEAGRDLGRWGKTRLSGFVRTVTDIVDIVPIGADGEGVGNLPRASRVGATDVTTVQFDPLGWAGAKLDWTIGFERTRVRDPLTAQLRAIGSIRDGFASLSFRRDVPHSPLAWGGGLDYSHYSHNTRLSEIFYSREGPVFDNLFIEHKDVWGLTVRAQVSNLLNARHRLDRDVFADRRTLAPLAFRQHGDELIGPLFDLKVSGSF